MALQQNRTLWLRKTLVRPRPKQGQTPTLYEAVPDTLHTKVEAYLNTMTTVDTASEDVEMLELRGQRHLRPFQVPADSLSHLNEVFL